MLSWHPRAAIKAAIILLWSMETSRCVLMSFVGLQEVSLTMVAASDVYSKYVYSNIPSEERSALYDLYSATDGDSWHWRGYRGTWNFSIADVNPCNEAWQGITCSNQSTNSPDSYLWHVVELQLNDYNLVGYIPSTLSALTELTKIDLASNYMVSSIPYSLGTLGNLQYLDLDGNLLTNAIPTSVCLLTNLTYLALQQNELNGTILDCIGSMQSLYYLSVGINELTGTIPESLGQLSNIGWFGLHQNLLHGTVPDDIAELFVNATDFYVYYNMLTGTIPSSLLIMKRMINLGMDNNMLVGRVPDLFSTLHYFQYVQIYDNLLTGSLPTSMSRLRNLQYLFVQNNLFTGPVHGLFNSSLQQHILSIQLSNNRFIGPLPGDIFNFPQLQAFSAVKNCLDVSLPLMICNAKKLITLALDGLKSAATCRSVVLRGLSGAYTLAPQDIEVRIPPCMFQFPNLKVLHLSGNGLKGSLPSDLQLSAELSDLSLSYNYLTGPIPNSFQRKNWTNLDLSHNRLNGTLRTDSFSYPTKNNSLTLKVNRLSGNIPSVLMSVEHISILSGNLYSCSLDGSDLPEHDESVTTYGCGSNFFNITYYIWISLMAALGCIVLLIMHLSSKFRFSIDYREVVFKLQKWHNLLTLLERDTDDKMKLKTLKQYNVVNGIVLRASWYATIYIMFVLLPVYIALDVYYSTHTYCYAWTVSSAYLSGTVCFVVMFVFWVLFQGLQLVGPAFELQRSNYDNSSDEHKRQLINRRYQETATMRGKRYRVKRWLIYLAYVLINIIVVAGVNISYVYLALYQSHSVIIIVQVLLSIFTFCWNNLLSPYTVRWALYLISQLNTNIKISFNEFFSCQLFVALTNNIVIPCLVVFVISPDCFYSFFIPDSEVTSTFTDNECFNYNYIDNTCIDLYSYNRTTSYEPPFIYGYQCSSTILSSYSSVYMMVCIGATFVSPMVKATIHRLYTSSTKGSLWFRFLQYIFPRMLMPLDCDSIDFNYLPTRDIFDPFIEADQLLVSDLIYVGLLFTFGTAFPLLAVALIITLATRLYLRNVAVGRFVTICIEKRLFAYVDIVEEECRDLPLMETLQKCWLMITVLSGSFYSLFLFDTFGSSSKQASFWILIVVPILPCIAFALPKWIAQCRKGSSTKEKSEQEMQHMKDHIVDVVGVVSGPVMKVIDLSKEGVEMLALCRDDLTSPSTPQCVVNPMTEKYVDG